MRKVDIRAYKNSLRDKAKAMRRGMDPEEKAQMDRQITDRICSLYQYREAQTLLCYVSKPIEVDTIPLIQRALADGKQVACPRCVEGTRQMEFYRIHAPSAYWSPRCRGVRNSPILPGACALFRH